MSQPQAVPLLGGFTLLSACEEEEEMPAVHECAPEKYQTSKQASEDVWEGVGLRVTPLGWFWSTEGFGRGAGSRGASS